MDFVHQSRVESVRGNTRIEIASLEKAEKYISVRVGASSAVTGRRRRGILRSFVFSLCARIGRCEKWETIEERS